MSRFHLGALLALILSCSLLRAQTTESPASAPEPTASQDEVVRKEVERQLAEALKKQKQWTFELKPNGGGFAITSPDEQLQFRLLGYAQTVGTLTNDDFLNSFQSGDFRVRRARVDWLTTFQKKYELFIEYDGVPQTGNLVEARLNWQLKGDDLQLRVGKFVVPISEEGWRSSRNYDTIERFIVINTMYGLPALDTQYGVMLHGQVLPENKLTYYVGVWNGNASASENARDSNGDKEVQARVVYKFTPALRAGIGVDHDVEETQTLRLNSLTGTRFASLDVHGKRQGVDADYFYEKGRFSSRGEWMQYQFSDRDVDLGGGFLQFAYFTRGDYSRGFQPLLRIETAQLSDDRTSGPGSVSRINALTAGFNWYLSGHVRFQLNAIAEEFNRDAGQNVRGDGVKPSLLTELQFRF
jgi:phosphate-selective porin